MSFVVISILETILESHYMFRVVYNGTEPETAPDPEKYKTPGTTSNCSCNITASVATNNTTSHSHEEDAYPHTEPHPVLSTIDDICLVSVNTYFLLLSKGVGKCQYLVLFKGVGKCQHLLFSKM